MVVTRATRASQGPPPLTPAAEDLDDLLDLCDKQGDAALSMPPPQDSSPGVSMSEVSDHHDTEELAEDLGINLTPILSAKNREAACLKQQKSALNHFSTFLTIYWNSELTKKDYSTFTEKPLFEYITDDDLNDELIGTFCNYLSDAQCKGSSSIRDGKLSWQTAQNYCSQVCGYFVNDRPDLSKDLVQKIFVKTSDASYLSRSKKQMMRKISNRSKEHGVPLVKPKAGASKKDWIAIAASCVLESSVDLAEFWSLCTALTHMASRGNEMGYLQHQHGKCVDCSESGAMDNVAAAYVVNNFKQGGTSQLMHIFPHATNWELDHMFALSYHMALSDSSSDYVFPRTSEAALKTNKDDKNDSTGVSKVWSDKFARVQSNMHKAMQDLEDGSPHSSLDHEFTPGLCSHSGKKYAITEMGRTLSPIYLMFRAGWTLENIHTLFDYIVRDAHHDVKAAKTCAGWKAKWNDEIWGGYSNQMSDLDEETHAKFDLFTKALFRNQESKMELGLRRLHGFSVLRFFQSFEAFLKEASYDHKHPFIARVESSLQEADIPLSMFQTWQEAIQRSFAQRNFYGMSLHESEVPEMLKVNAKPLLEHISLLKMVSKNQAEELQILSNKFHQVVDKVGQLVDKVEHLHTNIRGVLIQQDELSNILVNHICVKLGIHEPRASETAETLLALNGDPDTNRTNPPDTNRTNPSLEGRPVGPVPWPHKERLETGRYDTFRSKYGRAPIPCESLFKVWFQDQLAVAYYNMDDAAKRKERNHFSISKAVVHMMLKSLDEYPKEEDDLDKLAKQAMTKIKEVHNLEKLPSRSRMATKTKFGPSLFEEGDYMAKNFPDSTPDSVAEFFGVHRGNNPHGKKRKRGSSMLPLDSGLSTRD